MAGITSNIGLATGIDIKSTIDQLLAIEARPRDALTARTKDVQNEQVAVKDLAARLLSMEFSAKKLTDTKLYEQRSVTSGNPAAITATITGAATVGNYLFTPLRAAQSQQSLTSGLSGLDAVLGAGEFTFRYGGFLDGNTNLDELNGGAGFQRGRIRITDRSGRSAEIDLRFARTIEDVLKAINDDPTIGVRAETHGDRIRLVDTTGQTFSTLKVHEVDLGTTAASLGLATIDVAEDSADGEDILRLYNGISLDRLNGGGGVQIDDAAPDLKIYFRDTSDPLVIDFNKVPATGQTAVKQRTLGDVLAVLNAADPTRLKAEISEDGERIVLTDLTTDEDGNFHVESLNGSRVAEDLGLAANQAPRSKDSPPTITGERLLNGLRTSRLTDLNGGTGLGTLGLLSITDRTGAQTNVDLSNAETTDDIIDAINASGLAVKARLNEARNGFQIDDTSGSTTGNLIVANGDAETTTADKLNLAVDAAVNTVNSRGLNLRVVSHSTKLASLNGGAGVAKGSLTIFDTKGSGATLNITDAHKSIGDVVKAINGLGLKVEARINDAGDGIALVDTGGGTGKIRVLEGGKTTAADLHLKGESSLVAIDGKQTAVLDGSTTYKIKLTATDTAADLIAKVNSLKAGVTASSLNDGTSSKPLRLVFSGQRSGDIGQLSFDTSQLGLSVSESVHAQDARLLTGSIAGFASGIVATSATGVYTDVLPGVSLTVNSTSETPVTVSVGASDSNIVATIQAMVDTYNGMVGKLKDYTKFDIATNTKGVLQGDGSIQRIQNEVGSLLSGRFSSAGTIKSVEALGIELNQDGTLTFDTDKFRALMAQEPTAVKDFFTTKTHGFVARITGVLERLAGDNSLLINRDLALERRITQAQEKIDFYSARLEKSRERWQLTFYNLELAIGKIKNNLGAISQIQAIPPLGSSSS